MASILQGFRTRVTLPTEVMFRLFSMAFSAATLFVFIWFATSVPLGKKTFWAHLRSIGSTAEVQELADGTREEAGHMMERITGTRKPLPKVPDGTNVVEVISPPPVHAKATASHKAPSSPAPSHTAQPKLVRR